MHHTITSCSFPAASTVACCQLSCQCWNIERSCWYLVYQNIVVTLLRLDGLRQNQLERGRARGVLQGHDCNSHTSLHCKCSCVLCIWVPERAYGRPWHWAFCGRIQRLNMLTCTLASFWNMSSLTWLLCLWWSLYCMKQQSNYTVIAVFSAQFVC